MLVFCIDLRIEIGEHAMLLDRFYSAYGIDVARVRPSYPVTYYIKEGIRVVYSTAVGGMEGQLDRVMSTAWEKGQSYHSFGRLMREQRGHYNPPQRTTPGPGRWNGLPFSEIPDYRENVRLIAELTNRLGILMIVRVAPMRDDFSFIDDRFGTKKFEPWLKDWSRTLEEGFPNVRVSRPELLYVDPTLCWGATHLNEKGAEKFTTVIAAEVTQALAGPQVGGASSISRGSGPST